MYYTKDRLLENNVCFKNGPPEWYFEDFQVDRKITCVTKDRFLFLNVEFNLKGFKKKQITTINDTL